MTKLIAEIGWNFLGDINLAKKMIKAAKDNGADLIKTQIFSVKNLKPGPWDNDGRREIYLKSELTDKKFKVLFDYAKKLKIDFFASALNRDGVDILRKYQRKYIKIASAESRNHDLIKYASKYFKNIIISTGATKYTEIKKLFKININKNKIILLHCNSSYPCSYKKLNLPRIEKLKKLSKKIGFSDHSAGIYGSVLALKYNPMFIEKHFTIDQKLPGRDNALAILPDDLRNLKNFILINKDVNLDLGKNFQKEEQIIRDVYSGRWG